MFNADLMQFKDEMLKTLREMEKKIMTKVNKNQTDISSEINIINDSIKLLRDNNNSMIETMAQQKVNIDKISDFEKSLKKMNSSISGHENRINDSITEISYIRNRCEKSITETFSVPGVIGKNCKYSNFTEYINNNIKEITSLKSDKESNKKETKQLRQKLDQGAKNLTNLSDSLVNRAKLYTDNTKKIIIELIDNKINEIEAKNMELMTKIYKIDMDTEQRIKEFRNEIEDFSTKKNEQFQKMEDNLLLINYNIEEMNKKFDSAKEELNNLRNIEVQLKNDINELRKVFTNNNINKKESNYLNRINNSIINEERHIPMYHSGKFLSIYKFNENIKNNDFNKGPKSPNSKMEKKSRINLLLNDSQNIYNQINNNSTYNNVYINNQKNKNTIELNTVLKNKNDENIYYSEEMSQTDDKDENNENDENKNIESSKMISNNDLTDKDFIKSPDRKKTIDPNNIFNKNDNIFSFDINPILEQNTINANTNKKRAFNLHKTIKGKKISLENYISSPNKIKSKINEIKNDNEQKEFNNESNNQHTLILNEKINNTINLISDNSQQIKNKNYNFFPFLKNKKLAFSQEKINTINRNNNNNKQISLNKKKANKGYKIVKLSLDENIMTPYNTNGLLTIASKKYLNNHLIKVDESTPFNDIYLLKNLNDKNNNSYPKKNSNYSKTTQEFYNSNNSNIKNNTMYKYENSKEKKASKTINLVDAYHYGNVKFHFLKKKQ